jgi:hypothetical protein
MTEYALILAGHAVVIFGLYGVYAVGNNLGSLACGVDPSLGQRVKTPDAWPAERGFEAFQQAERQAQMTPDEHPLDGLEWLDLEMPRNMTLWGHQANARTVRPRQATIMPAVMRIALVEKTGT